MLRHSHSSRFSSRRRPFHHLWPGLFLFAALLLPCHGWRPSLYPENWTPPETSSFTTDKLIQDFSYAGYRRGEVPVPEVAGPVFDAVTTYGADPTGTRDSTAAIQAAIDAAAAAGGGVVFLPAGTYRVEPQGSDPFALRIRDPDIVLRGAGTGETFLLNTSYEMRGKHVIRVAPSSTSLGPEMAITADLDNPTRRIPVADASAFDVRDKVRMEWTFTQGWIDEHNQGSWWSAPGTTPAPAQYLREVVAVDTTGNWIEVDVPTRYTMKTRDEARVRTIGGQLSGVGIEGLSIGNVQHPGNEWGEGDFNRSGRSAYDVHASWLISMHDSYDSWITGVSSFQAAGNTTTCHMLSNGIRLLRSSRVTVADTFMRRSQYGGGGGNGYMFRVQHSHDNLIADCIAEFSRHGFVISHAGTSGNVFLRCEDRETQRSTGSSGSYQTGGSGSDHHMHFSHSNLFDRCHVHNSFYTAHHRGNSGTTPHALTSAHGVYWNTSGSGNRGGAIVRSGQGRYGYVIGTSGSRDSATNPTGGNTSPVDHLEGIGIGDSLAPQSLYLDQLAKREQGMLLFASEGASSPPTTDYPLTATAHSYGSGPISYHWTQLSGPTASIADPSSPDTTVALLANGIHVFEITAEDGDKSASSQVTVTVDDSIVVPTVTSAALASVDTIVGRGQDNASAPGYYPDSGNDVIGVTGSDATLTREDRNVVLAYALPELPVGDTLENATLQFEITAYRNHSGADPGLAVYLLDTAGPSGSGTTFFFHGESDPNPEAIRIGGTDLSEPQGDQVNYPAGTHVQTYALDGEALDLLREIYGGDHLPDQPQVFFRFNLDHLVSGGGNGDLGGSSLDRYRIDTGSGATSLALFSVPPPAITFDDWIAGFDLGDLAGPGDDPDGDGIPNAIEAWFRTHPGEANPGLAIVASEGGVAILTHPRNPESPTDINGFYEWSPNLIDWYPGGDGPAGGPTVSFATETDEDTTTVTATADGRIDRMFLRAAVSIQ